MTNKVLAVAGMTLMVLGTVLLGYAAMLDMSYAQPHRWRDRPTVLALGAALLVVLGAVLTAA